MQNHTGKGRIRYPWMRSKETLFGYPTIKMRERPGVGEPQELCVVGHKGEAWKYSETTVSILIRTPIRANRLAKELGKAEGYKTGDEALFKNIDPKWLANIDPISSSGWMLAKMRKIDPLLRQEGIKGSNRGKGA